jgi:hypothetical protein
MGCAGAPCDIPGCGAAAPGATVPLGLSISIESTKISVT